MAARLLVPRTGHEHIGRHIDFHLNGYLIKFGTPLPALAMSKSASHAELAEADVGTSTPPYHEAPPTSSSTASTPVCPMCCEEDAAVVLSACQHRSCGVCLLRWMEREESSGRDTGPTCPFCRMAIREGDILRVMGRPFCPRIVAADDEIDELTLHWINQNTMP